jgi:hypothetical protein
VSVGRKLVDHLGGGGGGVNPGRLLDEPTEWVPESDHLLVPEGTISHDCISSILKGRLRPDQFVVRVAKAHPGNGRPLQICVGVNTWWCPADRVVAAKVGSVFGADCVMRVTQYVVTPAGRVQDIVILKAELWSERRRRRWRSHRIGTSTQLMRQTNTCARSRVI